nr:MAG TPA: Minor structural protein 4 [Caudoviricetes sp.]
MAVRGFFRAAEYQINRIALSEGDVFHTENGLVKSAARQSDGRWKVVLQERFQGDVTGFRAGDILRGAYNGIGTSGGAAEIRTSWLRVEAVDAKAGTLTASLYADNQTPEGRNAPPIALMRLARWGNTTDPERQSHIVESATDGRIVRRVKVSAPIVDGAQSDGFVVGKLPAWLREHFGAAVADASDYVFARGIITQNILRYTPAGRPLAERVDRGLWSASSRYFYEQQNPETGAFEISRVWHDGALYELARGGNGNTAPAAQSTHWTLIQAKPKDGRPGDAGKSAPPTGANLIDGTSFRNMEDVRRWEHFDRFTFDTSQTDRVHPLAQAVCALKDLNWIKGSLKIASLLRPNTTYTISIYSKGAPGILAVHYSALPGTSRYVSCNNVDRNKWKRYTYTFTTTDTVPDNANIFLGCTDMLAKTYFSALKLEEGEEATAWCLSENDKTGTPAANPNLWHCTDYVTRPHFTEGYLNKKPYASILPGGVDGDNYFHIEGNNEERVAHVLDQPFGNRYPRGTWYTISFKCRGSGSARFHCYPERWKKDVHYFPRIKTDGIDGIGNGYLISYITLTKEWVTHSLSFFYDAEEDDLPKVLRTFFSLPKREGSYLDICHPKMETGEFATPWCLSEMDKKGESSYTHVAYSNSPNGNPCTLDPKGEKFAYLGTYTDENKDASTDHARYVWAKVQGEKGDNGRGVSRMRAFYMLTTERNAPQPDTSGWTEIAPQPTKESPWLWSYERSEYTDGHADQTAVRLIGHYGKDGTNGTSIRAQYSVDARTWHDDFAAGDVWMRTGNGTTWGGALRVVGESGADGKSPVYDFAASSQLATASGTTAPTIRGMWQDAPPTLREGEVLWYRLTAANGKITYGRLSGRNSYIHIAYANSEDGAKDFTLEEDLGRGGEIEFSYFGIYADFDERASQDNDDYVWTRLRGVDGKDGLTPNANLLDDTDFKNLGRKESAWSVGTFGEEPLGGRANADLFPPSVSGCYPALCAINPGTKQGEYAQLWQNIGRLIPGRTYTFSVYVRGASDAWLVVYPNPTEHFRPDTVKQDEWTRVSLTFTAPKTKATEDTLVFLRAWHREEQPHKGFAKNVVWCAPKLEEGGTVTPWTPSRNDLRGNDGAPGARGAAVRPLGDYDKLPASTAFESGHTGEQYVDVVQVRQGAQVQFYQCKKPHTKSADKAPAADSEWWELGMYQSFIATDLFLAKLSLIENLQVENVVGRDANRNTTFELDASTGTAYFGGTATFAGFIRRRPVVITPDNWKEYGGELANSVIYLNPFRVGTYIIFRGNFGTLRPTINTGGSPLNDGKESSTPDDSQAMRYYGAQFMVFNDLEPSPNTLLTVGGLIIGNKQTAIFTMKGPNHADPGLWWHGELIRRW